MIGHGRAGARRFVTAKDHADRVDSYRLNPPPPLPARLNWMARVLLAPRDRYAQCHGDCTVDCGACKGEEVEPPRD